MHSSLWLRLSSASLLSNILFYLGTLSCLDFSPDGKLLVGTGGYTAPRIWDVKSGKLLRTLQTKQDGVGGTSGSNIVFSSDGQTLSGLVETAASGSITYGAWAVWSVQTGKLIRMLTQFGSDAVLCANGKLLIDVQDGALNAYNTFTGKLEFRIAQLENLERRDNIVLHISSDGQYVAVVNDLGEEKYYNNRILLFDVKPNSVASELLGSHSFSWCKFVSKRPLLITTTKDSYYRDTRDGTLQIWSIKP